MYRKIEFQFDKLGSILRNIVQNWQSGFSFEKKGSNLTNVLKTEFLVINKLYRKIEFKFDTLGSKLRNMAPNWQFGFSIDKNGSKLTKVVKTEFLVITQLYWKIDFKLDKIWFQNWEIKFRIENLCSELTERVQSWQGTKNWNYSDNSAAV